MTETGGRIAPVCPMLTGGGGVRKLHQAGFDSLPIPWLFTRGKKIMDRRQFMKNLGLMLAATQLPKTAFLGSRALATTEVAFPAVHTTYALGFVVSQEMLEDDMYGALSDASRLLQKQAQLNIHHSLLLEEYNAVQD